MSLLVLTTSFCILITSRTIKLNDLQFYYLLCFSHHTISKQYQVSFKYISGVPFVLSRAYSLCQTFKADGHTQGLSGKTSRFTNWH